MDDVKLRSMSASRMTLDAMSVALGKPRHEIVKRLAELGCEIPEKIQVDTLALFRMWHDRRHTVTSIAQHFGVSPKLIYRAASRYGLPQRRRIIVGVSLEDPVDPDEEQASAESLRLAPSTERLAAPIRDGWSDEVRYQRRVQRVQPITYDRLGWSA